MKIVITGAGGQLGIALAHALADHQVLGLGRDALDVTEPERIADVITEERPDLVINSAAYTDVDGAETDRNEAFRVNGTAPGHLAVATAEVGIPLVHVSTDYVFDGRRDSPYTEFDLTHPLSVYGESKLAGEDAVRIHNPMHYVVRTAWLYSAGGRNFLNRMRSMAQQPEVRVVDDQHGSPTYAPHLAQAIGRLIATESFGTYHIAGSGGTTWHGLACELYRALGIDTPVVAVSTAEFPRPATRPAFAVLETAIEPAIVLPPWRAGLEAFVREVGTSA
jgi:dTDP-4-dehydrorhamnose reductase